MSESSVYVCRVDTPEGTKDYVTVISPEAAFSQGLVAEAVVGVLLKPLETGEAITPDIFAANRVFVDFLHGVIARHGAEQRGCQAEATRLGEGWIYIIDQRTATPHGAVPPEDIIGAFEVRDGEVVADSYWPSHNHQILSTNGFFRLDDGLWECPLRELPSQHEEQ